MKQFKNEVDIIQKMAINLNSRFVVKKRLEKTLLYIAPKNIYCSKTKLAISGIFRNSISNFD